MSDAPVANQIGRSNSNALIILVSLQPDHVRHVLIRRGLVLMRPLPFLQIPNLETPMAADERDLAFEPKRRHMSPGRRSRPWRSDVPCSAREWRCREKIRRSRAERELLLWASALIRENS